MRRLHLASGERRASLPGRIDDHDARARGPEHLMHVKNAACHPGYIFDKQWKPDDIMKVK
jgi:hypothetical protein